MSDAVVSARRLYSNELSENQGKAPRGGEEVNLEVDRSIVNSISKSKEKAATDSKESDTYKLKNELLERQLDELRRVTNELRAEVNDLQSQLGISEQALLDAQSQVNDFEQSIDDYKKETFEQAIKEGRSSIEEQMTLVKSEGREEFVSLLGGLESAYTQVISAAENTILDIAFAATLKLFGETHLSKNGQYRKYLLDMVQDLTANLSSFSHLRIQVSPSDHQLIVSAGTSTGRKGEAASSVAGIPVDCFISDESIQQGGCQVSSIHGDLDLRFEQRIESLKDALLSAQMKRVKK